MSARTVLPTVRAGVACAALGVVVALAGCASDDYGGGGVSTSVAVGYGGYYGPGWYGGYYEPYPPVVVVPPDDRPDRPDRPDSGNRPTTLPSDVGGPSAKTSVAPSRPSTASRPTSRPAPRPAPRPMPRRR